MTSSPPAPLATHAAFQSWECGMLRLRNRIAMAPMTRRMAADGGLATPEIAAYYRRRAEGGVGLIISEGTHIDGRHAPDTMTVPRFETTEQIAAWKNVVDAVHEAGGAFAPQLWHTGRLSLDPVGPSAGELPPRRDGTLRPPCKEITREEMERVRREFVHSAVAAREIGCDAIELHGAHGYLLDSFVSAQTNQRTDEYGGSLENRMRYPLEVLRSVREAVGPEYPIIYRFSQWLMEDYAEQKFPTPNELGIFVSALRETGASILHVSTRRATDIPFPDEDAALTLAGWTRKLSGLPTIAVGSVALTLSMDKSYGEERDVVADPSPALDLIENGQADMIAVGRSLIANPDWVHVVRGRGWESLKPYDAKLLEKLE